MTIVTNTRAALDAALNSPGLTLLLIFDDPDSATQKVHDRAEEITGAAFHKTILIRDLSLLLPDERADWSAARGRFAVLGNEPKHSIQIGPISDLCNQDGSASKLRILKAFSKGDQG